MRARALLLTLTLAGTATLTACTTSSNGDSAGAPAGVPTPAASATASAHNAADAMFASMMIPHHAQAVQMADLMLAKQDIPAEVTALAKAIKQAQQPEIDQMNGFLTSYGQPTVDPTASPMQMHGMAMDGMLTDDQLQQLRDADGATATRLFLTQMVGHHTGAIAMAKTEISTGKDPAAIALAKNIVTDQQAEISQMRTLLNQL
ncbi:DUF305 domain-containing protein [Amnibacterium endophyticum]|uniref:DUF305 domain-containing protein n=1 Tax=Amnibacterium endophyticum TaxID=2109337 RepID=A0ABW4LIA1_9MICO